MSKWRPILIGIIASYGALWLFDYLLPDSQTSLYVSYTTTFLEWIVAFSIGGYVAVRGFLVPAVASTVVVVAGIILHTAYMAGQYDLPVSPVLTNNLPIVAITALSAAIGSGIGMWLAAKVPQRIRPS